MSALLFIVVLVFEAQVWSPLRNEVLLAVPDPSLAVATVPEVILAPSKLGIWPAVRPVNLEASP